MDLGIGPLEVLVILVVVLLVWGPEKIVQTGRNLGKFVNTFKKMSSNFTSEITKELDDEDKSSPGPSK
jgi:TatA/E family protein of Tat protein translocase